MAHQSHKMTYNNTATCPQRTTNVYNFITSNNNISTDNNNNVPDIQLSETVCLPKSYSTRQTFQQITMKTAGLPT